MEYPGDPDRLITLLNDPTVDPNGRDMFGWTALHKFASWDKVDLIDILLTLSPCPIDLNCQGGPDQFSCLHCAVDMGAKRAVSYLISTTGIDISIQSKQGMTPYQLSVYKGYQEIADLFPI
jgi:ankyrin repeat protein